MFGKTDKDILIFLVGKFFQKLFYCELKGEFPYSTEVAIIFQAWEEIEQRAVDLDLLVIDITDLWKAEFSLSSFCHDELPFLCYVWPSHLFECKPAIDATTDSKEIMAGLGEHYFLIRGRSQHVFKDH